MLRSLKHTINMSGFAAPGGGGGVEGVNCIIICGNPFFLNVIAVLPLMNPRNPATVDITFLCTILYISTGLLDFFHQPFKLE